MVELDTTRLPRRGEDISPLQDALEALRFEAEDYITTGNPLTLLDARDRLSDLAVLIDRLELLRPALVMLEPSVPIC